MAFLGKTYPIENAQLEIRFWYPPGGDHEYYRINWVEPERNLMLGFHQDADHPELGECHVQLEYENIEVDRYEVEFIDAHPLAVLDQRLQQFPVALEAIQWQGGKPLLRGFID
ncbi:MULTISPECIES: hypothetical protein [unclassified Haladaptatus]|uniref:hypothetical protein n=1 Tax=unclassified Haladaptatus TaxID=2622732 RepID=UPI0023E867F2|nr:MULTISPECIES: hypothetical protein [unclassified Haladaptatus]